MPCVDDVRPAMGRGTGMRGERARMGPVVVAVDGPAASGKGTLAKGIARHLGVLHLDTGLLYRATGLALLDAGTPLDDAASAIAAASRLTPEQLRDTRLREGRVGEAGSIVSAIPGVRKELQAFQRSFATHPDGAVLDGRDIGTVIAPDATAKIYVTASAEERALRHARDLTGRGEPADVDDILRRIKVRDERDSTREVAPLRPAPDAFTLDTTHLDATRSLEAAIGFILWKTSGRGASA